MTTNLTADVPPSSRPKPTVHLETFGCQMNEYDSELVKRLLTNDGFEFVTERDRADVVLMNTCAIREHAHERVYGQLDELRAIKKRRGLVVGVLGCMAQNLKAELLNEAPIVDVLAGPDGYRHLPSLLSAALEQGATLPRAQAQAVDLSEEETYDDILPVREPGVNAWIAIMRGCDNFCTFCVVPYTRGRERSRDPEGIIREARLLAQQGYRQVSLLGQNVNSYRYGDWDFARLIRAVADVPGIERVRFTSPHPKDFPPALLDAIATHPHICKHIHLPLQSGNDEVLDRMGRSYTAAEFVALVERIRAMHPDIALTTDVICGFPGETDEQYRDTYRLIERLRFHAAYIFKYSERKNTIAARKFPDDVPEAVKGDRVARLVAMQKNIALSLNQTRIGQTVQVMVEGESKRSSEDNRQWMGKADDSLTVIWPRYEGDGIEVGRLVDIRIDAATVTSLFGVPAPSTGAEVSLSRSARHDHSVESDDVLPVSMSATPSGSLLSILPARR
ncbi:MAG: tRNA (N6-isopentenyl adenosine(37)-C2)-methylthiotransferase MiaB [Nitrospiraceae bacterium]